MDADQRIRDAQREYLDFLDDENDQKIYQQKIKDLIAEDGIRLNVNINDLRRKNAHRAAQLLQNSFEEMIAFENALKEMIGMVDAVYAKRQEHFFIGLEGSFGSKHVTPRTLNASYLGDMVCVEGIVTKCSLVRPKVVRSVHYCPKTKKALERRYTDLTSLDPYPSTAVYPTKDEEGNPLETEFGLCAYKDHQTFTIQEMPEKSPAGQMPRAVDVIIDNDLVDCCKPGDRVLVVGMYRCLPSKKNSYTTGAFRTILVCNYVHHVNKDDSPLITATDVTQIRKVARDKRQDPFELLAKSLAPSIHGHEYIKKAVLCMLLGGNEKVLENGTRIRGDINVLLVGDPSVAKSQILRFVLNTAPRAVATTGRGSSGVGLTAAVTTDKDSGDRRLEAGAMVLADRGIVCIDEFDKMSDIDRTAIHEVMEQGRVTIAKAGIHAKLNARCSVLAAANPVYGRYDQYKTPMENIGLQDSLLSRFDLLFILLDKMEPESDRSIADHVLRMHRYRDAAQAEGSVVPLQTGADTLATGNPDVESDEEGDTPVYEPFNSTLHTSRRKSDRILSQAFMRKYIHIARDIKPALTRDAAEFIADEYTKLRSQETMLVGNVARTQPVTARTLETLIRLATAHAKSRMSRNIEYQDALCAVELVQFAYFKKVQKKPKRRKHSSDEEDGEEKRTRKEQEEADPYHFSNGPDEEVPASLAEERNRQRRQRQASQEEAIDTTETMDTTESTNTEVTDAAPQRLASFKTLLLQMYQQERAHSFSLDRVLEYVNESDKFTEAEVRSMIQTMSDSNQVFMTDDIVFLI